jgi:hypothetical protein
LRQPVRVETLLNFATLIGCHHSSSSSRDSESSFRAH